MKKNQFFSALIIIMTLLTNCTKDSVDVMKNFSSTYKILKSVKQVQGDPYTQTETTDYEYDTKNNLLKKTFIRDGEVKAQTVLTETYRYDVNGFLIERNTKTVIADPKVPVRQNTETKKFSYANDLVSFIETTIKDIRGSVSVETEKFAYDAKAGLTSIEKSTQDGTISTMIYSGGQLTDYVVKSNKGITTRPYTIQNGLVTKITGEGYYTTNVFNEKGQVLKSEIYVGGKLNSYLVYEWSDAISAESTVRDFKGIPCGQDEMGTTGVCNKFQFFGDINNGKGEIKQLNESSYINKKDDKGYISTIDLVNQQFSATPNTPPTVIKSNQCKFLPTKIKINL